MRRDPTFIFNFVNGMLDKSNEFKYSKGYVVWMSTPTSIVFEFALQNVCKTLGKDCKISLSIPKNSL
jgi:hypothetical protein